MVKRVSIDHSVQITHRCPFSILTRCTYLAGTASPQEPDEVAAVHWLSAEEIFDYDVAPSFLKRDVERLETHRRPTRD
jgi:hypothetical protein